MKIMETNVNIINSMPFYFFSPADSFTAISVSVLKIRKFSEFWEHEFCWKQQFLTNDRKN